MKENLLRRDKDNRGMSLVEIILVVAIMSAMIGMISYGINLVSGKPAEECVQKLASHLQHARTVTVGKSQTSITIFMNANGQIVVRESSVWILDNLGNSTVDERETIVGEDGVTVTCFFEDGSNIVIGTDTIDLVFDRGSGALQTTKVNGVVGPQCVEITASRANKTKSIFITPITGRVSIE